jgi:class 3 adenylate cyclase
MANVSKSQKLSSLTEDYHEALVGSGLIDDVVDTSSLEVHPYRYAEGEFICRHGDPADSLWVIVNGSVAVKLEETTLFVRRRNEVVGEQHLVGNGYRRIYDLIAVESSVEVLSITREQIENHPEAAVIWRNVARIISLKLRNASKKVSSLTRQLSDDTRILHAYTNEYALKRRLEVGGAHQAEYKVEKAVIWFSDVDGFSSHTSKMSPDRMADVVQRFFNAQSHPILSNGGYVDKFMGDGMMAFWILSTPDSAARQECLAALRAADEAVSAVAEIRIGNKPLSLRIGLHVGLAVSGDFGSATRHQFTLIGTEVNKAARLEQVHAEDISEGTSDLGSVRLSSEFFHELSATVQRRFNRKAVARAKNIGRLELFTSTS